MKRRIPLLAPLALLPLLHAARAPEAAPALGPGSVLAMHVRLFAAAERASAEEVRSLLFDGQEMGWIFEGDGKDGRPGVFQSFLPSGSGTARIDGQEDATGRLAAWAAGWKHEVGTAWADCGSGALSFCAFELTRSRGAGEEATSERWHGTSLVTYEDGKGEDQGWKIRHLHLSPADPEAVQAGRKL